MAWGLFSAAQVDPRIKAVATSAMYDISGVMRNGWLNNGTDEDRRKTLADVAAQRWADVDTLPVAARVRYTLVRPLP